MRKLRNILIGGLAVLGMTLGAACAGGGEEAPESADEQATVEEDAAREEGAVEEQAAADSGLLDCGGTEVESVLNSGDGPTLVVECPAGWYQEPDPNSSQIKLIRGDDINGDSVSVTAFGAPLDVPEGGTPVEFTVGDLTFTGRERAGLTSVISEADGQYLDIYMKYVSPDEPEGEAILNSIHFK